MAFSWPRFCIQRHLPIFGILPQRHLTHHTTIIILTSTNNNLTLFPTKHSYDDRLTTENITYYATGHPALIVIFNHITTVLPRLSNEGTATVWVGHEATAFWVCNMHTFSYSSF